MGMTVRQILYHHCGDIHERRRHGPFCERCGCISEDCECWLEELPDDYEIEPADLPDWENL